MSNTIEGFVRVSGYSQSDLDDARRSGASTERTRLLNKANNKYVYPVGDTGQGDRSLLDSSGEPIYNAVNAANVYAKGDSDGYGRGYNAGISAGENRVKNTPSDFFNANNLDNYTLHISRTTEGHSTDTERGPYPVKGDGWVFVHGYNYNGTTGFKSTLFINDVDVWHVTQNQVAWFSVNKGDVVQVRVDITNADGGSGNTRAVIVTYKG